MNNEKLPGDYVAGLVDGEGCFYLMYRHETKRNRTNKTTYYRWIPYFCINVREDDKDLIQKVSNTLSCGKIYLLKKRKKQNNWGDTVWFGVQNIDDVYNKIIPFFKKFPLRGKKKFDFELWEKAVKIIYDHKHKEPPFRWTHGLGRGQWRLKPYTSKEHNLLQEIRQKMRQFKANRDKEYKNQPVSI
ncbi:LAGLIDADG family homing endonuclease [Candidatus Berkelbacteria bacterium]|nr:LAGLIDADG family homing endonuclease [Candidatus Berkelbacteria bacterium]MBI2588485.1 LAGLIDADG family homing endonuclease [Candidatus Berkelbacteria bacterium]